MASQEPSLHSNRAAVPQSVEAITKDAQQYPYDATLAAKFYLRTARMLLKEAEIYEREGDIEKTYHALFRHAHLVLANLATHPDIKDESVRRKFVEAKQAVNVNLEKLDLLKPKVQQRYNEYIQLEKERQARRAINRQKRDAQGSPAPHDDAPVYSSAQLHGHEHKTFAVELANKEISRRAEQRRRDREERYATSYTMQHVRSHLEPGPGESPGEHSGSEPARVSHLNVRYPAMPAKQVHESGNAGVSISFDHDDPRRSPLSSKPPTLPPKPPLRTSSQAPPRPEKIAQVIKGKAREGSAAHVFASTAQLENGTSLRTLFLPQTLRTTFLRIAHSNTLLNLETCAFLAGTLISNALFVNRLIVPAQIATSDTCEMTNESELFDYVDSESDMMILGWIHTHPTQTCFMSSRDLHTHAGYQMMLAESVAIVCAPSKGDTVHGGDWGAYRLTDPPGKKTVLACQKPGLFHPHDVDDIYTDALRPGHVAEVQGLEFEVVDLREKP